MTGPTPSYRGYRFPPEISSHAVWVYHRFGLSVRDIEDLLAERGVTVTYEVIRQWCRTFGLDYARRLRRRRGRMGDTWYLDEVFIKFQGRPQYLRRAVDEDGDTIDILAQSRRNRRAALLFFLKLLKGQGCVPRRLITDKLRSYPAACRTVMPSVGHCTDPYANNRAHQPTRGSRSIRCVGPNLLPTRNGFSQCMDPFRISFVSVATPCGPSIIGACEHRPSVSGER